MEQEVEERREMIYERAEMVEVTAKVAAKKLRRPAKDFALWRRSSKRSRRKSMRRWATSKRPSVASIAVARGTGLRTRISTSTLP